MKTFLQTSLLTLLVTLGLSVQAEENNSNQAAPNQPAAAVAAPAAASNAKADEPTPCPLPGEPASNCPAPNRAAEDTEGGVPYVASAGIRPEINLNIILTTPGQNAHSSPQPLPPWRNIPKNESGK